MRVRDYWLAGSAVAGSVALWMLLRRTGPAQPRTHILDLEPSPESPGPENGSVQFIGTATTLIRFGNLTILTDPNFLHRGDRIHLGYGRHATRLTDPEREFEALPQIDFVLLSNLHEEHFDKLVERRLDPHTPILTTASAARTLARRGFLNTYALRTWDRVNVRKGPVSLRVTALPARHAARPFSAAMPDVMGSMLEFRHDPDGRHYSIYISGDTLIFRDLYEIPRRHPRVDLALLHLGGARVLGALASMDAAQGIQALRIIRPEIAIPIHYNDYDIFEEPVEEFLREAEREGWRDRVRYLRHGETCSFASSGTPLEARPLV